MSAALSLTALPGDGGIRAAASPSWWPMAWMGSRSQPCKRRCWRQAAKVHLIHRAGLVKPTSGEPFDATGTLENSRRCCSTESCCPMVRRREGSGRPLDVMDFILRTVPHGKDHPSASGLESADRAGWCLGDTGDGDADPGIVMGAAAKADHAVADFITALGRHRHPNVRRVRWRPERFTPRRRSANPSARYTNADARCVSRIRRGFARLDGRG